MGFHNLSNRSSKSIYCPNCEQIHKKNFKKWSKNRENGEDLIVCKCGTKMWVGYYMLDGAPVINKFEPMTLFSKT